MLWGPGPHGWPAADRRGRLPRVEPRERAEFLAVKALCYRGLSSAALRAAVSERLARFLRADAFAFLALHPPSGLPIHAVHTRPDGMCDVAHERAVLVSPVAEFGRRATAARRAYRLEELLPAERPEADPYVTDVLRPFGFAHEVQAGFAAGGRALGSLQLGRRTGRPPFPASAGGARHRARGGDWCGGADARRS